MRIEREREIYLCDSPPRNQPPQCRSKRFKSKLTSNDESKRSQASPRAPIFSPLNFQSIKEEVDQVNTVRLQVKWGAK